MDRCRQASNLMNISQLHSLTPEQIRDLLGLMKELNPEIKVTAEMLEAVVADPGARFFAAIGPDGHIVGTATLCVSYSPTGRKGGIEDVVVSSACRGQGLGRQLMEHIIGYSRKELSPIVLHLTSRPQRVAANRLYRSLGFQPYDTNVYKLPL